MADSSSLGICHLPFRLSLAARRVGILLLLAALGAPVAAAGQAAQTRIQIPRVDTAPTLDDFAGGTGPGVAVSNFLQREPGDLVPVSEPTTAYLSYDHDALYVAFVCKASNPASIRARMSRRESVFDDDWVGVFLDPFQERQRAYMFFSNPIGIQADGVTSESTGDDMSFDAVWTTAARRTADGYVALIAIPFKSLRFPSGTDPRGWGISLARRLPTRTETAFWPGITLRVNGFTAQFGVMDGIRGVSPGRNVQFIPYGTFAGSRVLDDTSDVRASHADFRGGVDTKVVLRDKITVDATINPDFSQVESDEPQVTVNQRFEVFFPEKRPFFLENADYFQTPITLFFSRRIHDPQLGSRVTGRVGRWSLGALAMDDRQPGREVDAASDASGDRMVNVVLRARRDFSNQSNVGFLVTSRDFGASSSRVGSIDGRLRLNPRWIADGQALVTKDTALDGASTSGEALWLGLHRSGRTFSNDLTYQDLSPGVRAPLGFVPRTDIRRVTQFAAFRWYPKKRRVTTFGPNMFVEGTWDHAGTLQDWTVRFPFQVQLGQTYLFVRHARMMERFAGVDYPEHENVVNVFSTVISWLTFNAAYSSGTRPNFFPAPGVSPSLAHFIDASAGLTFRPRSGLLLDETYLYSRLSQPSASIFDNHIVRSKVNYQFTRALSLRGIVDYNAILPNQALVSLDRRKHLTADLLVTYLVHPGTAVYIGYTDGYDNLRRDPISGDLKLGGAPTLSTGRQLFVKSSYLLRF
jgi:hypothetical protein